MPDPTPWPLAVARRFDPRSAHLDFYLRNGGMLNLQTKRGCPFRCVYCSYPYIEGRTMRYEPPEQIARTAIALQQAGAKYFFITDSAFNADIDQSLAVAQAFKKVGLTIPWGCFFAPLPMPADYFTLWRNAVSSTWSLAPNPCAMLSLPVMANLFRAVTCLRLKKRPMPRSFTWPTISCSAVRERRQRHWRNLFHIWISSKKRFCFCFAACESIPTPPFTKPPYRRGRLSSEQSILEPVFSAPFHKPGRHRPATGRTRTGKVSLGPGGRRRTDQSDSGPPVQAGPHWTTVGVFDSVVGLFHAQTRPASVYRIINSSGLPEDLREKL